MLSGPPAPADSLANRLPIETPAFVCDEARLEADCALVARLTRGSGGRLLFSLKASSITGVIEIVARHVDGFSASSLFEASLVREVVGPHAIVHVASPGLRPQDIPQLAQLADYLSFNSVSQFERLAPGLADEVRMGIRLNPGLSLLSDARYDPCRPHSKLGASAQEIRDLFEGRPRLAERLSGLHVHNNCDAEDFCGLLRTVRQIDQLLAPILPALRWINLGGGYTFRCDPDLVDLEAGIALLRERGLEVFMEPGAALVRSGVQLVARVVDLFQRDGKAIAVLDASVNHVPEVFEYADIPDNEPWVLGHIDDGRFAYLLAGCTCLAGDVFGDYAFAEPLAIGDQVVFPEMGAYAFVKAHWFNGVNLPSIYARSSDGRLQLKHRFAFADFARHNGWSPGKR